MGNPIIEKINNPFLHLPPEKRPDSASPFDMKLVFNTLAGEQQRSFAQLMQQIHLFHMDSYNKPDTTREHDSQLYTMASAAGLDEIAMEMARNWGRKDPDGPERVKGCDHLRTWPDIQSAAPHTVQIWLAHKEPTSSLFGFNIGGGDTFSIHHNNHTVMSQDGKVLKPGDWMGGLLVEYARYRIWRDEFGENGRQAPKPERTLKLGQLGLGPV